MKYYIDARHSIRKTFINKLFSKDVFSKNLEDGVNYYCDALDEYNEEYELFYELVNSTINQSIEKNQNLSELQIKITNPYLIEFSDILTECLNEFYSRDGIKQKYLENLSASGISLSNKNFSEDLNKFDLLITSYMMIVKDSNENPPPIDSYPQFLFAVRSICELVPKYEVLMSQINELNNEIILSENHLDL